ncbi:hypothetical protein O181_074925 [Austropuccinia psidii MF-1]|uniref:Uncharacterized protein n=1 Tax=Austropuccinia psidii MF-1 TaxID=1389203 RepID=A0A9Q3IDH8_9BASI|nr:hypothetical protein [Austropuccinia psidii MF-1]
MEGYVSSSLAPPTPQGFILMENGRKEVRPSFTLGRTLSRLPDDMSQRDTLQRSHGNQQKMESQQAVQAPGGKGIQHKG